MSITLGIYDIFAYTIPGLLYLYIIIEFLRRLRAIQVSISGLPDLSSGTGLIIVLLLAIVAHLVGHLFDYFAQRFVFRLLRRRKLTEVALQEVKERYPNLDIQFGAKDWSLLFTILRQRQPDISRTIDSFEANSIMLRNICFGLFLSILLQGYQLLVSYTHVNLLVFLGILLLCFISHQRSHMFHQWFIRGILEASLNYGNNLEEVVGPQKSKNLQPSKLSRKSPSRRKTP